MLNYPTVQIRILPLLAATFALHYTGKALGDLYQGNQKAVERGDFGILANLHSTSSGLKSLCTELVANGIETCRRAMGGHGFGGASGLVQLNADYISRLTVEGDNWMITQQVARYIIKLTKEIRDQKSQSGVPKNRTAKNIQRYVQSNGEMGAADILNDDDEVVRAFEIRAAHLVRI